MSQHPEILRVATPLCSSIVSGNLRDVPDDAQQRARIALQRHEPILAELLVVPLGQGLDNTTFLVEDLVVRVSKSQGLAAEARLLDVVAPRVSVPVPQPRFVDDELGIIAYRLLPGEPLLGKSAFPGLAHRLGRFLRELHSIDPAGLGDLLPRDDADPGEWLKELDGPPDLLALLSATVPRPGDEYALVHCDLGAEHLLAVGEDLTGVIDWSDAAFADPALDFARLYRDFGRDFLVSVVDAYGGLRDPGRTVQRIVYYARCAALEDLEYGRTSGLGAYANAAEASIRRLFHSSEPHLRG
jgi:aminoglycoside phosphotransferase (APT) family kinase protein